MCFYTDILFDKKLTHTDSKREKGINFIRKEKILFYLLNKRSVFILNDHLINVQYPKLSEVPFLLFTHNIMVPLMIWFTLQSFLQYPFEPEFTEKSVCLGIGMMG